MPAPATSSMASRVAPVLAAVALVAAVWMAYQMAHTAVLVSRMSAWPTVPATLDEVELRRPGSATTRTLSVAARYHYSVSGRTYSATQVSLYTPDSIGSFFQRTYDDLHGRRARGETVPAHVNPAAPAEAVLLPVWRPEIFAFQSALMRLLGGAGLFVLVRFRRPAAATAGSEWDGLPAGDDADATFPTSTSTPGRAQVPGVRHVSPGSAVDMSERLPSRAAWGRRLVLIGVVLLAADYLLLDGSRNDPYRLIDRLLASQVTATGTIFVSPPDDRLPAVFDAQRRSQGVEATVAVEKSTPQAVTYQVRLTAATADAGREAIQRLQSAVRDGFKAQTGHEITTFSDAFVAPVLTGTARALEASILGGLLLLGVACLGIGAWRAR